MLGPAATLPQGSDEERHLTRIFRRLTPEDRRTLLAFADFLAARPRVAAGDARAIEPRPLPRPPEESVVAAIRRLSQVYFMLDRGPLLNETSTLMSAHILQGRPADAVIDELECLFARHYATYREPFEQG